VKVRRVRRLEGGVGAGLVGTVLAHAAAALFLVAAVRPQPAGPPVYAVELVAAPAPPPEERRAPEAIQRPPAEREAPAKTRVKKPEPRPAPKPPELRERTEPNPRATPPAEPLPGEQPSTGAALANVSTPGLQFPFPEYLRNIVQEVYRRWQRPLGNAALRTEVSFLILRDGRVREIRVTRSSGSFSFDLAAQGAIEAAGAAGAFGPLPDGWSADVLPVSFYFTPRVP
jgi:outer membrane biosynthesis protein TonB